MTFHIDPLASRPAPTAPDRSIARVAVSLEDLLVGVSPAIQEVRETIARVAESRLPVLIEGPTGSGKEVVAGCLHRLSGRSGNIVPVNVAAMPETMFESLMFGHVRGAFSGATAEHAGFMAQANGGTLFLDELAALPLSAQPKLLRAMEDGSYRPIGAVRDRLSDCRIVAATNEPIALLRATGRLRSDLVFRLAKLLIRLSPLRERREDIPVLAKYFARQAVPAGVHEFTPEAMDRLIAHEWPGNVRELKTTMEAALVWTDGSIITEQGIAAVLRQAELEVIPCSSPQAGRLITVLDACEWNVVAAATQLEVHYTTVYRRMKRWGIRPPRMGGGAERR